MNPYEMDLDRGPANYAPLTPVSFLARSAAVYPTKPAVIHGEGTFTYAEFFARCRRLASALTRRGIGVGDSVTIMAPNVPAMLEAHYGGPLAGGGAPPPRPGGRRRNPGGFGPGSPEDPGHRHRRPALPG